MSAGVHLVARGDSLSRIAHKNGMSLPQIVKLNPSLAKNPNRIYPGMTIKLSDNIVNPAIQKIKQKQKAITGISPRKDLVIPIIFPEYKYTGFPGT